MSKLTLLSSGFSSPHFFTSLTTRLTIGSAVCFSEGISASIMLMVPNNEWFYFAATRLTFIIWAAFWCFRESKLGADIGDLCLFDFLFNMLALMCNSAGIDAGTFWYPTLSIFILKIVRVYLWQSSETQQHGWGKFGPMTWFHAKYYEPRVSIRPGSRLEKEIVVAMLGAAIASIVIRFIPDVWRVAMTWIVPLSFEFLYGPMQLRNLKIFNNLLSASVEREKELEAENFRLKQEIEQLQIAQQHTTQPDPDNVSAELSTAYYQMAPERRTHYLETGKRFARLYPADEQ
jgi:hypothetical protein